MKTKLTVLVEDKNLRPELESEHGLSIFVETSDLKFIFDCGHTGIAWKNAEKLNINLSEINFVVISHSHYDHAGGFPSLLNFVKPKFIFTGQNFWNEKFSRTNDGFKYRGAGFTQKDLISWNIKQKICRDTLKLNENIFLVGNFTRRYDFEKIPEKFVYGENKLPDNFEDEICLAIKDDDGLTLIVACSHAGILNIVSTVQERFNLPVKNLIGGIHLLDADDWRIEKTFRELKNFGIKKFALCHCSGEKISTNNLSTGDILEF